MTSDDISFTQDDMNRQFIICALYPDIIREHQHLLSASIEAAIKGDKHKALLYSEASKMLAEKAVNLYEQGDQKKEKQRAFWEKFVEEHPITNKDLLEQSLMFSGSIAPLRNPDEIVKSLQKEIATSQSIESPEVILRKVTFEYGTEIYKKENSKRLKSILDDFVMGKQNLKTLNIAIQEGIPERLLSYNSKNNDDKHFAITRCINQLEEDYGISKEKAIETVNYLALGLGWEIEKGEVVAKIQENNFINEKLNEQFKEITELSTNIDTVLSKKLLNIDELYSITRKINELKKRNDIPSSFYEKTFQNKIKKINAIEQVFSKFDNGSFISSCLTFWFWGLIGIITSVICFIKEGIGIINYSFFICFLGCINWGVIEGCIYFCINRVLIRKNIGKVKKDIKIKKICLDNFIIFAIRFILLFSVGGIIGGIFAEIAFRGTLLYCILLSSAILVLNYIYIIHGDWM